MPMHTPLDLKALAMAVGGKKTRIAEVAAAGRATGYVAGGISPHGQRKRIPVVTGASGCPPWRPGPVPAGWCRWPRRSRSR